MVINLDFYKMVTRSFSVRRVEVVTVNLAWDLENAVERFCLRNKRLSLMQVETNLGRVSVLDDDRAMMT